MSDCGICNDPLSDSEFALCSECDSKLHFECAEILESTWNRMGNNRRTTWKCKVCLKGNISKKAVTQLHEEFLVKMQETIKDQFSIHEKNFNNQIADFQKAIDFVSQKIDDFDGKMSEFTTKLKHVVKEHDELRSENTKLKNDLFKCQLQLENLEVYNRNKNLQIEGVPELPNETMPEIITKLSQAVGENVSFEVDIQAAHRIPTNHPRGPKPIILQFSNRQKRDSVLKKCKQAKIKADVFARGVPNTNVYVNEHLTPYYKNILFHAKKLRDKGYKYVWVSEGKIYVRKSENEGKVRIVTIDDINKLAGCDIVGKSTVNK